MNIHLGVLTGVAREADAFCRHQPTGFPVTVHVSAGNPELARRRQRSMVAAGASHLISFGFAGGLDPALRPGTVLLPEAVMAPDGRVYPVDDEWHAKALALLTEEAPLTGRIAASDSVVTTVADKHSLYEATRAVAVDMESHLIAEIARPFLILRVVCDPADAVLPPVVLAAVRRNGATSVTRLLAALSRSPQQIPALISLGRAAKHAERALLRCCSRGASSGFGLI